jgi:hypothetical protein
MLEVAFSCPVCSRMFLEDCPFAGPIPRHLDPLLGQPCAGSGLALESFLEIPDHWQHHPRDDVDWPRWEDRQPGQAVPTPFGLPPAERRGPDGPPTEGKRPPRPPPRTDATRSARPPREPPAAAER